MRILLFSIILFACTIKTYADEKPWDIDSSVVSKFDAIDCFYANNAYLSTDSLCYIHSQMPGRMPTFWFTAAISMVGTYTLYGAGAGPIACGIIYICSDGNRRETKMAILGCLTGAAVGGLAKWLSVK